MHMADALVSPAVGGTFWAAAAAMIACASAQVRRSLDERKVPLMGVLGAFVFAAQMINFTVPATGSSGHLGGGLLLAILLGPSAAFLAIASVLMVQALFFSDGGLLALGCNIINLGFFPAYIAFPLMYRRLVGHSPRQPRLVLASIVAAIIGLQLGALGVVLETVASGISSLPFTTFLLLMQPIHLAIGVIEGIVTALIVWFVYHARPDVLNSALQDKPIGSFPVRSMAFTFLAAAMLIGGSLSWYASTAPDGLEWSISRVTGTENLPDQEDQMHERLAAFQARTALLPDYSLPEKNTNTPRDLPGGERLETSLAGIIGSAVTLAVCLVAGLLLRKRSMSQGFSAER